MFDYVKLVTLMTAHRKAAVGLATSTAGVVCIFDWTGLRTSAQVQSEADQRAKQIAEADSVSRKRRTATFNKGLDVPTAISEALSEAGVVPRRQRRPRTL